MTEKPDPVAEAQCMVSALYLDAPKQVADEFQIWLDRWGPFLRAAVEYNRLMLRDSRNAMRLGISEEIHLARGAMYDAYREATKERE